MGIENLEKYASYFGLGEKTNIELPGEVSGTLAGKSLYNRLGETWYYGNSLSAVIGQAENNFTPLQIARYIAILANGGKRIEPHLIKSVINNEGDIMPNEELQQYLDDVLNRQADDLPEDLDISQSTLDAIFEGMESVTGDSGGTAADPVSTGAASAGDRTGGQRIRVLRL
jgi:penicillin-binding protein 2